MQIQNNSKIPGWGWWRYTLHMSIKSDISTRHRSAKRRAFLLILAGSLEPPYSLLRTISTPPCPLPWSDKSIKNTHLFSQACSLLLFLLPLDSSANPLASFPFTFPLFFSVTVLQSANCLVPSWWIHFILSNVTYWFFSLSWEMRAVWIRGCCRVVHFNHLLLKGWF